MVHINGTYSVLHIIHYNTIFDKYKIRNKSLFTSFVQLPINFWNNSGKSFCRFKQWLNETIAFLLKKLLSVPL